jgi:hypothetical protein
MGDLVNGHASAIQRLAQPIGGSGSGIKTQLHAGPLKEKAEYLSHGATAHHQDLH